MAVSRSCAAIVILCVADAVGMVSSPGIGAFPDAEADICGDLFRNGATRPIIGARGNVQSKWRTS